MTRERFLAVIWMSLAVIVCGGGVDSAQGQTGPSAALVGEVSSGEEGAMEGVLVSAQRAGSTVTITVVSDARGRYSFPRAKLEPGRYALRIRAVGYELEGAGAVEVTAEKATEVDLRLRKARDLASQLTNAEWLWSMTGTEAQKKALLGCVGCHTLERIVRSRHNAAEFVKVQQRMRSYNASSTPLSPKPRRSPSEESSEDLERMARQADFLSSVNLSASSTWSYPLRTLPRPKGKETRVLITEYDLPRPDIQPHDAVMDSHGMVWFSNWTIPNLGRLDPKTAQVVEFPAPEIRPGTPASLHDVRLDQDGNVWLSLGGGNVGRFDPKTQKFQFWSLPNDTGGPRVNISMVASQFHRVDGKVWANDIEYKGGKGLHRLDLRSGRMDTIDIFHNIPKDSPAATRPHRVYGINADSQNNIYYLDFGSEYIGRMDAKTGKETLYRTPTLNSAPRRGNLDSQDRLWFAEFLGNRIGMLDTKTERLQEWAIPLPWASPYDAIADKNGDAWAGDMTTDRIVRLNTKTGEFTAYLLPRPANLRRLDMDNSTTPATIWTGNNHGASILELEPLE